MDALEKAYPAEPGARFPLEAVSNLPVATSSGDAVQLSFVLHQANGRIGHNSTQPKLILVLGRNLL